MDESSHGMRAIHGLTKFNGRDDFHIWKFCMLRHLGRAGLRNHVLTEKFEAFASQEKSDEWDRRNVSTESMIIQSVEDSVIDSLTDCMTAKDMWEMLCKKNESSGLENLLRLQTELNSVWKDHSKTMSDYVKKLRVVFSKLKGACKVVDDQSKLVKLLNDLLMEEFEAIRTNLAYQVGISFLYKVRDL